MKRLRTTLLALMFVLFASLTLVACGGNDAKTLATAKENLTVDLLQNESIQKVVGDVKLPTADGKVVITWASSDPTIISVQGKVTRPAEDKTVKLTATLTLGKESDYKEFTLLVLAADTSAALAAKEALITHYEDTLESETWKATENVELLAKINDLPIVWEVVAGGDNFTTAGVVTRPAYSAGDATIQLKATIDGTVSHTFYFLVEKLEQTVEEKIQVELDRITVVPSSSTGYQELNFVTVETVKIDDVDVTVTWESSDITVMTHTGELVAFEDAEFKEVTLTATITYKGVTKSKVVEFKVLGVKTFNNFKEALSTDNFTVVSGNVIGAKVKVEGVALYKDIEDGYYLVSEENMLGFVYGTRDANVVKAGKLYDVTFTVDVYFGTYQLKGVSFSNERDGTLPVITPVEMTLEQIVGLPKPTNTTPNQHTLYTLKDVAVRVDDPEDNYKTFLIPVDLPAGTALTDQNSIMIYYKSNLDVIKSLNGQTILSIEVINNGYRTNNNVWNVNFIGTLEDVELDLTVEDRVAIIKNGFEAAIPASILKNMELDLPTTKDEATITWESTNLDVIALDGTVTLPAESTTVTLKATITLEGVTEVFEKEVEINVLPTTTIEDALLSEAANKELFKVEGIVTGISGNNTYTFEDASGAIAIYSSVKLDVGFEYILFGTRDAYNGLEQLRYVDAIKGEAKALPAAVVLTEADLTNEVLLPLQSRLVSIENATVTTVNADQYGNIILTLTVGSKTINLRWDNRVALPAGAEDHLESIKQGAVVNVVAAPLGWSNNPQLGYNDASQLVIPVAETDEEKVNAAALALELPTVLATAAPLTLPVEGEYEVAIAWASSHVDIIALDGTVALPAETTTVTLTATLTLGTETKDVTFVITVVSADGMTVAMARAATGNVVVQGIVTGIANYESGDVKYIFLSDVDGTTIAVYNPTDAESLVLGDLVKVTGSRAVHNGLEQIGDGSTVAVLESDQTVPAATVLTEFPTFTADDQGKRYSFEGLTVVSASGRNLRLTDGTTEMLVYVDINKEALTDHIATAVGKKVDLVNIHLGWYNSAQFLMFNTSEVVIHELTDNEKALADLNNIDLPTSIATDSKLTLPIAGSLHEAVITWTSSDETIIATDGKVVLPTEETTVTLTATATLNAAEAVKTFTIAVKPAGTPTEQEIAYEDFESYTSTNSYTVDPLTAGDYTIVYGNTVSSASPVYGSMHVLIRVAKNTSNVGSITYKTSETPITKVSFQARYTHATAVVTVQFSNDGGATWGEAVGVEGLTTTYSTVPFEIASNVTNANTFRILVTTSEVQTSHRDLLLDDIRVYGIV